MFLYRFGVPAAFIPAREISRGTPIALTEHRENAFIYRVEARIREPELRDNPFHASEAFRAPFTLLLSYCFKSYIPLQPVLLLT